MMISKRPIQAMAAAFVLALASVAAQAQNIVSIGTDGEYTVALVDAPCPVPGWNKMATLNISGAHGGGRAIGCWRPAKRVTQIELTWTDVRTKHELPEIMPAAIFENVD